MRELRRIRAHWHKACWKDYNWRKYVTELRARRDGLPWMGYGTRDAFMSS
jgi:hypothetical protein